jgi:hypothetical protein
VEKKKHTVNSLFVVRFFDARQTHSLSCAFSFAHSKVFFSWALLCPERNCQKNFFVVCLLLTHGKLMSLSLFDAPKIKTLKCAFFFAHDKVNFS